MQLLAEIIVQSNLVLQCQRYGGPPTLVCIGGAFGAAQANLCGVN
jgi:hypothetical protein